MRDFSDAEKDRTTFSCRFVIENGYITLCRKGRPRKGRKGAGDFDLSIVWPDTDEDSPMGFIKVSHPSWNTLPRFVLLAGKRNKDHAPMWRLLCPITRNLVQVLFYHPNSQLFGKREAEAVQIL